MGLTDEMCRTTERLRDEAVARGHTGADAIGYIIARLLAENEQFRRTIDAAEEALNAGAPGPVVAALLAVSIGKES